MIAMAMLVTRTDTPPSVISQSFEPHKINIPKAPALGLLLEKPLFDGYNQRIADRPDRSPISFDLYKVNFVVGLCNPVVVVLILLIGCDGQIQGTMDH